MLLAIKKVWRVKLIGALLLFMSWVFQMTSVSVGALQQPTRSLHVLLGFTLTYLVILGLPQLLGSWLTPAACDRLSKDALLIFTIYALALWLFPTAFSVDNVSVRHTRLGILVSLLAVPMPYLRRNGVIGIRLPWTKSSDEIWYKTNLLGARILFCAGVISFVLGGLGAGWFTVTITLGISVMVVATTIYASRLYNHFR